MKILTVRKEKKKITMKTLTWNEMGIQMKKLQMNQQAYQINFDDCVVKGK